MTKAVAMARQSTDARQPARMRGCIWRKTQPALASAPARSNGLKARSSQPGRLNERAMQSCEKPARQNGNQRWDNSGHDGELFQQAANHGVPIPSGGEERSSETCGDSSKGRPRVGLRINQ
jgi:hypothetical protein